MCQAKIYSKVLAPGTDLGPCLVSAMGLRSNHGFGIVFRRVFDVGVRNDSVQGFPGFSEGGGCHCITACPEYSKCACKPLHEVAGS